MTAPAGRRPDIIVTGGGVAALEFVLALEALLRDRVHVTVVAPNRDFVLRPALVAAPLDPGVRWRWPLSELADAIGFTLVGAAVAGVDGATRRVILRSGDTLPYDTLVLATGARTVPASDAAVQLGDAAGAEALQAVHEELARGAVRRVAFVVPSRAGWTLPLYEAALLTADAHPAASLSVHTPETAPLEAYGPEASAAVAAALEAAGIAFAGGGAPFDPEGVDRVVSVPLVRGPDLEGVPATGLYGLIPVDDHGRVRGLEHVFAIGDATEHPVKQAGVAGVQADRAAEAVAAHYGHRVRPTPVAPALRATLLTGRGAPLLLNGGQGPRKLPGHHLGPFLAGWAARTPQPA